MQTFNYDRSVLDLAAEKTEALARMHQQAAVLLVSLMTRLRPLFPIKPLDRAADKTAVNQLLHEPGMPAAVLNGISVVRLFRLFYTLGFVDDQGDFYFYDVADLKQLIEAGSVTVQPAEHSADPEQVGAIERLLQDQGTLWQNALVESAVTKNGWWGPNAAALSDRPDPPKLPYVLNPGGEQKLLASKHFQVQGSQTGRTSSLKPNHSNPSKAEPDVRRPITTVGELRAAIRCCEDEEPLTLTLIELPSNQKIDLVLTQPTSMAGGRATAMWCERKHIVSEPKWEGGMASGQPGEAD